MVKNSIFTHSKNGLEENTSKYWFNNHPARIY